MRKSFFLRTTSFRPSIRLGKHGRPMRDPDGHNDSGASGDNSGGNNGSGGNESSGGNNGGQSFDPNTFWNVSGDDANGSPGNSGSADSTNQSSGTQQQQNQPTLLDRINSADFGSSVMTEQAIQQLAEGNTEAFHQGLNGFGRQVMQQTIREVIGILGPMRDQMFETMRNEMGQNFTQRENSADLLAAIPSAKNPAVRPVVDQIFNRAMALCKNDRPAAIQMTKDMMKFTATTTGDDIGLPARSASDSMGLPQSSNTNWLEELSGRS